MPTTYRQEVQEALRLYAGEDPYTNAIGLNGALRDGVVTAEQQRIIDLVQEAFDQTLPLPRPLTLYRGTGEDVHFNGSADPGFMSTSDDLEVAEEFATSTGGARPTVYKITVPAGSKVIDIAPYAGGGMEYQREFLLPPGTALERGRGRSEGGLNVVEARVVSTQAAKPKVASTRPASPPRSTITPRSMSRSWPSPATNELPGAYLQRLLDGEVEGRLPIRSLQTGLVEEMDVRVSGDRFLARDASGDWRVVVIGKDKTGRYQPETRYVVSAPLPVEPAPAVALSGTSNDQLRDTFIRHQVGLTRVSSALGRQAQALLNATEADLAALIKRRVERLVGTDLTTTAALERLKALDAEVRSIRLEAHGEVYKLWREQLREVAQHETAYTAAAVATAAPVVLDLVRVLPSFLKTLVDTHPFEGRVLKGWADRIAAADIDRITGQVRIGLVQGETAQQIAARVIGSAALQGANGVTEITRRDAMALTRTAVNTFANEARKAFSEANSDIADREVFLATLDGRTTPICRSLDGNVYPVGEGPRPAMHWQCRSLRVLLLDGTVLGTRPLKTSTEQQLVREYRRANGLEGPASRSSLPRGHKGSFDEYSRRRVRELTGTTPASTTYQQFLSRQSAEFQDDVLGRARGRLFRQGGLTLDRFVEPSGRELPLAELARRERDAFIRAGLDPARWG